MEEEEGGSSKGGERGELCRTAGYLLNKQLQVLEVVGLELLDLRDEILYHLAKDLAILHDLLGLRRECMRGSGERGGGVGMMMMRRGDDDDEERG